MSLLGIGVSLMLLSLCLAVELDKSLLYGQNQHFFEANDANNHFATCMVRTQGFDLVKNLTKLPSDILTNFICNAVEKPTLQSKKADTLSLYRRYRETDPTAQLKNKFGSDNIDKLQYTLRNFFNDDVDNHFDTLMGYKSRFYYAELKVLKDVLGDISNVDDVIDAIKDLRDLKSLYSRLVGFDHTDNMGITAEGKTLMCDLVKKLPKAGDKSMCSYWALVSLLGEPCGPTYSTRS